MPALVVCPLAFFWDRGCGDPAPSHFLVIPTPSPRPPGQGAWQLPTPAPFVTACPAIPSFNPLPHLYCRTPYSPQPHWPSVCVSVPPSLGPPPTSAASGTPPHYLSVEKGRLTCSLTTLPTSTLSYSLREKAVVGSDTEEGFCLCLSLPACTALTPLTCLGIYGPREATPQTSRTGQERQHRDILSS